MKKSNKKGFKRVKVIKLSGGDIFEKKKHNKGAKERTRINFIKMKREAQSMEDKEKNKKKEPTPKDDKSKKRLLKEIAIDEAEYGNNAEEIPQKKKKKKAPKKDRVRF